MTTWISAFDCESALLRSRGGSFVFGASDEYFKLQGINPGK